MRDCFDCFCAFRRRNFSNRTVRQTGRDILAAAFAASDGSTGRRHCRKKCVRAALRPICCRRSYAAFNTVGNQSVGVLLKGRFTTNRICAKNSIYMDVTRTRNNNRVISPGDVCRLACCHSVKLCVLAARALRLQQTLLRHVVMTRYNTIPNRSTIFSK